MLLSLSARAQTLADLSFLTGEWQGQGFEESWGSALGGTMLGTSRAVENGQTVHKEFMLLEETPDGLFLKLYLPEKNKTMIFKPERHSHQEVEFARQDVPERLIYRRDGDRLHIQLEKAQGGFHLELHRVR
ncbi:MAG: hypothetical protein AMXMBFR33_37700 [Candidatus Xenobia bacterium]